MPNAVQVHAEGGRFVHDAAELDECGIHQFVLHILQSGGAVREAVGRLQRNYQHQQRGGERIFFHMLGQILGVFLRQSAVRLKNDFFFFIISLTI